MIKYTLTMAENKICQHSRESTALYESVRDIAASLDPATVLARLATHACDLLTAHHSVVYVMDPEAQALDAAAAVGDAATTSHAEHLLLGEGIVGAVAQSGVGDVIADAALDPRAIYIAEKLAAVQSVLCAPLLDGETVLGVIVLGRLKHMAPFVAQDLDFLMRLTSEAAVALKHAQLYAAEQQQVAELRAALAQQQASDQAKNQFIQNVSHELRTPLTIARGYAELLECEASMTAEQQEAIAIIARRLRMLAHLVGDLNVILNAKNKADEHEPVDFAAMVRDLAPDFRISAADKAIDLNVDVEPACALIWGDAVHLRRILDNLLGNALKFTPQGGTISVHLHQMGETLTLDVTDTGIGIPEDQRGRIFDRFYQADGENKEGACESGRCISRRHGGLGLGLTMVKEIVEAHNGTIHLQSAVGKGSTFSITLPVIIQK